VPLPDARPDERARWSRPVVQLWLWIEFIAFVVAMLAVDLLVFHREAH
jgi:hypothetical protein